MPIYHTTIGSGKNLVLLHGWGFSSAIFTDFIKQHKNKYCISAIDLPGHGKSSDVSDGIDKWADEIIKILPKNPILLGWSLGGLLAIKIAQKINISKLILVASTPKFIMDENWEFGINANNFNTFTHNLKNNYSKTLKRFISLQHNDKSQIKTLSQTIDKFPATKKSLNQGLNILLNTNLTKEIKRLNCNTKVILGKYDTLVPYEIENWYAKNNIESKILNTGHLPFLHKEFKL